MVLFFEIEQAIEKSSVEKDEQVDWTKAWGRSIRSSLSIRVKSTSPIMGCGSGRCWMS